MVKCGYIWNIFAISKTLSFRGITKLGACLHVQWRTFLSKHRLHWIQFCFVLSHDGVDVVVRWDIVFSLLVWAIHWKWKFWYEFQKVVKVIVYNFSRSPEYMTLGRTKESISAVNPASDTPGKIIPCNTIRIWTRRKAKGGNRCRVKR